MALSTRLTARQTQQLTMTPQLRQAIELLQMSSVELQKFIDSEVEKNPLLEVERPVETDAEAVESPAADIDHRFETAFERHRSKADSGDGNSFTENLARPPNLQDHLLSQLGMCDASPLLVALAKILVHELDDDGYLRADMDRIAARAGADTQDLQHALTLVQSCDPTGIAARNLAECFSLQLKERGELNELMSRFLDTLDDLALRTNAKRWSQLGIDAETYAELLAQIKALNPAPGKCFDQGFIQFAIPDVTVFRNNLGGWSVELNNSTLPAITVNEALADEVKTTGKEAAKFVSDCSKRADWLKRSIEQRSSTIQKVAAEIVRVQGAFFTLGISHLQPLTMKDVAEKVNINESTVSRVASSKYLSCERGTFELKFFFTKALRSTNGAGDVSNASIQQQIRKLIDDEAASSVLSDDKIVKILNNQGIDIARRTVTKYREGMNIPSSVERRRFKANLDKIR